MTHKTYVITKVRQWKINNIFAKDVKYIALNALNYMNIKSSEMCIMLATDKLIRQYNKQFRNIDKPTNVLSFKSDILYDNHMGDIIIALETLEAEAEVQGKTFYNHFAHILTHGILHLLGYDHVQESDAQVMESLEIKILSQIGINNPYGNTI